MGLTEQPSKRGRGRPRKVRPEASTLGYPGPFKADILKLTPEQLDTELVRLEAPSRPPIGRYFNDDGTPEVTDAEHEALLLRLKQAEVYSLHVRAWAESLSPAARWAILEAEEPKLYHWASAEDAFTVSVKRHTSDKEQARRVAAIIFANLTQPPTQEDHSNASQSPRATTPLTSKGHSKAPTV